MHKKDFFDILLSGRGDEYDKLKDIIKKEIVEPYLRAQGGKEYLAVSDIKKILPNDPLGLAKAFIDENADEFEDLDSKEIQKIETSLGMLNLHYNKMMVSIVSEINSDLTGETNYDDCKLLIEGAGFKKIYSNTFLSNESCSVNDLDYLKSNGVGMLNTQISDQNVRYQVEYNNELYYHPHDGAVIKVSYRKDGYYSPAVSFFAETKKYPNDADNFVSASSSPINYAEAFSISLSKELMFLRIQKILESGNTFNKNWHSFNPTIFKFERGDGSVLSVLNKINQDHPEAIESFLKYNIEEFYGLGSGYDFGTEMVNPADLKIVDCRISEMIDFTKELTDDDLKDLLLRDRFFDAKYVNKDRIGWYSDDFLKKAEDFGLDKSDVDRYYSVFIMAAHDRELSYADDGFKDFLNTLNGDEQKKLIELCENSSYKLRFPKNSRAALDECMKEFKSKFNAPLRGLH